MKLDEEALEELDPDNPLDVLYHRIALEVVEAVEKDGIEPEEASAVVSAHALHLDDETGLELIEAVDEGEDVQDYDRDLIDRIRGWLSR
jgi:hypothetical protein